MRIPIFMENVYMIMKQHIGNQVIGLIMDEKNSAYDDLIIKIVHWRDQTEVPEGRPLERLE